jgi:deoxyadenosine/deoxycytidine kinase
MAKIKAKHIAVAGNIGAGKTTLTEMLAKHYGWNAQFESVENNPYLNDFYSDMHRWSFNLQIYFLNNRFKQVLEVKNGTEVVIQDRTIYEDAFIFAPNLHAMGLLSTRDFENYQELFKTMSTMITPPDLMIYLKASIPQLVNNIQRRGREYEENIRLDYLKKLNGFYDKWISGYKQAKLLIIEVDDMDFVKNPEDFGKIIEKVDKEIHGLF